MPRATELDFDAVERAAVRMLHMTASIPARREEPGIRVATCVDEAGRRLYRSDVAFEVPAAAVARLIADEMVERLGDWNREFVAGEVRGELPTTPDARAWLVRVEYATPWPMGNREYVYGLRRRIDEAGRVWIVYQSVDDGSAPGRGCVRACLDATVHCVVPTGPDSCRLEHVLSNDLGGALPAWVQRHLLTSALLDANLRDCRAQRALFASGDRAGSS